MPLKNIDQKVVSQDIALDSYLRKLLDEIPSDLVLDQKKELVLAQEIVNKKQVKQTVTVKEKKNIRVVEKVNTNIESTHVINSLSVMPEWTQHEFQALFFKVDKIVLAAPLTELLKTIKIEKLPTKIPGQPSWFMGLLDVRDKRIGVLDTGQLIFGKVRGQQRDLTQQPFKSILMTYDGNWGLACDEILSIGKLEPDKVRWRTLRKKRPWLVGTVIEELTAVIDVNQLIPSRKSS